MSQSGWLWRRALLAIGLAVCLAKVESAQEVRQTSDPREIDGAKTPDKIPDRYAYPMLFQNLAGPDSDEWRKIFLRDSLLPESDAVILFRGAERFEQISAEGTSQISAARKNAPRPLPPAVLDMYRSWNDRMSDAVEEINRSFEFEISAEGQKRLQAYLLNHVKRNMVVHLGDRDLPAGAVPSDAASASSSPPTSSSQTVQRQSAGQPPFRAPLGAKALAAAMDEAGRIFIVQRMVERDRDVDIELWNGSTKPITAFRVAVCAPALGAQSGLDTFSSPGRSIDPGATYTLQVSKRSRPRCDPFTPKAVAVIFEDGTSVGTPREVEEMKFDRLGRMAESERVHQILAASNGAPDFAALLGLIGEVPSGEDDAIRAGIESEVEGVDAGEIKAADRGTRSAFYGGMAHVRATLLNEITRLAEYREPSTESRLALWEGLREKYRKQCEGFRSFRQHSVGSLYR